jgi:7-carboxy-7-deazaguanine synthase
MEGENPISAGDLAALVATMLASEAPIDAIALTGGEPLTQSDFVAAFLSSSRLAVPVLLETNGVLPRRLQQVLPLVDIVSMDIKLPSNTHEGAFWDDHAQFLDLARRKELYVKILVDQSTADDDVQRAVSLLAPLRPAVPTFLQPIVEASGCDAACRPLIDADRLAQLYSLARRHLPSIRVLPQMHKLLGIR